MKWDNVSRVIIEIKTHYKRLKTVRPEHSGVELMLPKTFYHNHLFPSLGLKHGYAPGFTDDEVRASWVDLVSDHMANKKQDSS